MISPRYQMLLVLLLGLVAIIGIIAVLKETTIEQFSSDDSIAQDSLSWIQPIITECLQKPHSVCIMSIDLDTIKERSPVECHGPGTSNLADEFHKPNTKTILTGKSDTAALLWSELNGKGRIVGMIPNPTGTSVLFQNTHVKAKSITVKRKIDISAKDLDKLEFVLPPRRWTCVKNGELWFPKLATEVQGNVSEDTRPVICSKSGRPYFTDEKAKFVFKSD